MMISVMALMASAAGVMTMMIMMMNVVMTGASTVLEVGVCPNITSHSNLDLERLAGDWYHILHFPSEDEPFSTCTHSTYSYTDGYLKVVTEGLDEVGRSIIRNGVLGKLSDSETDALQLDIDGMPPLSVWVTYTDYTSTACLYSCTQFPGLRADWAWAIARSPRPLVKLVARCRTKLAEFKVNTAKFERVPQRASCYKKKNN